MPIIIINNHFLSFGQHSATEENPFSASFATPTAYSVSTFKYIKLSSVDFL